ncbi:MAG: urate hydroxylase PuuD, partial [Pseudomonadota bacterium]|nr:urate hydroxylase PuuD [Pseudomonadota bacterium]
RGKQRSVHNTYFTLPVLIAMLSNHYSFVYSHPQRWLVLFGLMLAGALIRQFFVQRHGWHHGRAANPWPYAAAGVLLLLALIVWMRPAPSAPAAAPAVVDYAMLQPVIEQRCVSCHGAAVQMKNLRLDTQADVEQHAQQIYQQVVLTRVMPLSNSTQMTEAERALLARWFEARRP